MPKYYEFKIAGYYLYFTSYCVIECMHVHASDRKLTESGSAKFFVKDNGDTVLQNRGILNDREIRKIQEFIKQNYQEMYLKWSEYSIESYYGQKNQMITKIKNRQLLNCLFLFIESVRYPGLCIYMWLILQVPQDLWHEAFVWKCQSHNLSQIDRHP